MNAQTVIAIYWFCNLPRINIGPLRIFRLS